MGKEITVGLAAKDFELTGVDGNKIRLSDYRGKKNVVLVFNRGFA
jgi:thioredoxin-dependent peroxiredoxin